MGCHFLLQGIFPTQGSNPGLLHCRQTLYWLSYEGSPSRHELEQTPADSEGEGCLACWSSVLKFTGSQRVRRDLVTGQQQQQRGFILNFLRNHHTVFHSGFTIPTNSAQEFQLSPRSHQTLLFSLFFFYSSHPNRCDVRRLAFNWTIKGWLRQGNNRNQWKGMEGIILSYFRKKYVPCLLFSKTAARLGDWSQPAQ